MGEVYVNGKFEGTVQNIREFAEKVISLRRKAKISSNINVHIDERAEAVYIETGKGRARRPLIVVKDGNPLLTEKHIDQLEKGEIVNLPPFHFYMKVSTDESEDAFSGQTIPLDSKENDKTAKEIIANTRKKYGTSKDIVEKELKQLFEGEVKKKSTPKTKSKYSKSTKKISKKHNSSSVKYSFKFKSSKEKMHLFVQVYSKI